MVPTTSSVSEASMVPTTSFASAAAAVSKPDGEAKKLLEENERLKEERMCRYRCYETI
jgi:hypothetical protein